MGDSRGHRSMGMTRPPVLKQLQQNLEHYRPKEQLLREAVQNTMDAGGTRCEVFLDRISYNDCNCGESLCATLDDDERVQITRKERLSLKEFSGESLVFRNDTVFKESDWEAFKNLGEMHKETRPGDVGKFGLGAKSFFHVADMIMVLSGSHFLLLDPTGHVFRSGRDDNWEGTGWSSFEDGKDKSFAEIFETYKQTFLPFEKFGATSEGYPGGTVIRLPLRTARHVRSGEKTKRFLIKQTYSADDMEQWLADFPSELIRLSVFLHSLRELVVGVYEEASDKKPQIRCRVLIEASPEEARNQLSSWLRKSRNFSELKGKLHKAPHLDDYKLMVRVTEFGQLGDEASHRDLNFLVKSEVMKGGEHFDFFKNNLDTLTVVPFASVAIPLQQSTHDHRGFSAYAFLPFVKDTGLPFHVNAGFNLESNRAGLFRGCDIDGPDHPRRRWNQYLLAGSSIFADGVEVVTNHLHREALSAFSQAEGIRSRAALVFALKTSVYSLWPMASDSGVVDADHFGIIGAKFHKFLKDKEMFICDNNMSKRTLANSRLLRLQSFEKHGISAECIGRLLAASSPETVRDVVALPENVWFIVHREGASKVRDIALHEFFGTMMVPAFKSFLSTCVKEQNASSSFLSWDEVDSFVFFCLDEASTSADRGGGGGIEQVSNPSGGWVPSLKSIRVFETAAGNRAPLESLYHPSMREASATVGICPDDKFPCSRLLHPQGRLDVLNQAKVLQTTIPWKDIAELAKRFVGEPERDMQKLERLFTFFVDKVTGAVREARKETERRGTAPCTTQSLHPDIAAAIERICEVCWIPQFSGNAQYSQCSDFAAFRSVKEVRNHYWLPALFLVQPVMEYDLKFSDRDEFLDQVKWRGVQPGLLSKQIRELARIYGGQPKEKKEEMLGHLEASLKRLSARVMPGSFGYQEAKQKKRGETKQDRDALRGVHFIPVIEGEKLAMRTASNFVFGNDDYPPFCYKLPDKLNSFKCVEVLEDLGVNTTNLDKPDSVLHLLAEKSQGTISDHEVTSFLGLLGKVAQWVEAGKVTEAQRLQCQVLCRDGSCVSLKNVFFKGATTDSMIGQNLKIPAGWKELHPGISPETAEKLKVKMLSNLIWEQDGQSLGGMTFGQRAESVETSIRNKLADMQYDGSGFRVVLSEIAANAHDKGAKSLHVILDERNHGVEGTFGPHMNDVQGPALLFAMDTEFTDGDWKGIERIGETMKDDRFTDDGQFGTGKVAVYAVTDQPVIMSAGEVGFLDPTGKYAGKGIGGEVRGRKYKVDSQTFQTLFPKQLSIFDLPEECSAPRGTIFRLPLRLTGAQHALVQGTRGTSVAEVETDIAKWIADEASTFALFSHTIISLCIGKVSSDAISFTNLCELKIKSERLPVHSCPMDMCSSGVHWFNDWDHFTETLPQTFDELQAFAEQVGCLPKSRVLLFRRVIEVTVQSVASVQSTTDPYVICAALHCHQDLFRESLKNHRDRKRASLPLAVVALPLNPQRNFPLYARWPILSDDMLPFAVHAKWVLPSNRRQASGMTLQQEWNRELYDHVVSYAWSIAFSAGLEDHKATISSIDGTSSSTVGKISDWLAVPSNPLILDSFTGYFIDHLRRNGTAFVPVSGAGEVKVVPICECFVEENEGPSISDWAGGILSRTDYMSLIQQLLPISLLPDSVNGLLRPFAKKLNLCAVIERLKEEASRTFEGNMVMRLSDFPAGSPFREAAWVAKVFGLITRGMSQSKRRADHELDGLPLMLKEGNEILMRLSANNPPNVAHPNLKPLLPNACYPSDSLLGLLDQLPNEFLLRSIPRGLDPSKLLPLVFTEADIEKLETTFFVEQTSRYCRWARYFLERVSENVPTNGPQLEAFLGRFPVIPTECGKLVTGSLAGRVMDLTKKWSQWKDLLTKALQHSVEIYMFKDIPELPMPESIRNRLSATAGALCDNLIKAETKHRAITALSVEEHRRLMSMFAGCESLVPSQLGFLPIFEVLGSSDRFAVDDLGRDFVYLLRDNVYQERNLEQLLQRTLDFQGNSALSFGLPESVVDMLCTEYDFVKSVKTGDLLYTNVLNWLTRYVPDRSVFYDELYREWMLKLAQLWNEKNMPGLHNLKIQMQNSEFLFGRKCAAYADPRSPLVEAFSTRYYPLPQIISSDNSEVWNLWLDFLVEMGLVQELAPDDCKEYSDVLRVRPSLALDFWKYVCENESCRKQIKQGFDGLVYDPCLADYESDVACALARQRSKYRALLASVPGVSSESKLATAEENLFKASPDVTALVDPELRRLWAVHEMLPLDKFKVCVDQLRLFANLIREKRDDSSTLQNLLLTFDYLDRLFCESPSMDRFNAVFIELQRMGSAGTVTMELRNSVAKKWCMLVRWSECLTGNGTPWAHEVTRSPEAFIPCEDEFFMHSPGLQLRYNPSWDEAVVSNLTDCHISNPVIECFLHGDIRQSLEVSPLGFAWVKLLGVQLRKVLFLGEGDLSFSRCVWRRVCDAGTKKGYEIIITTYDSEQDIRRKYDQTSLDSLLGEVKKSPENLTLSFGIDACTLSQSLGQRRFDEIVWNFPNADGLDWERRTRELVDRFLDIVSPFLTDIGRVLFGFFVETLSYWEKIYGIPLGDFRQQRGFRLRDGSQLHLGCLVPGWHAKFYQDGYRWQMSKGDSQTCSLHGVWASDKSRKEKTALVVLTLQSCLLGRPFEFARVPVQPDLREFDVYASGDLEGLWSHGVNPEEAHLQELRADISRQRDSLQQEQYVLVQQLNAVEAAYREIEQERVRLQEWEARLERKQAELDTRESQLGRSV